ncbi:MAG TPA: dihydroxy-acid dehydratase, partial [Gemmatimonadaceae bacterium]
CIDLASRKLDVELTASELRTRRASWAAPTPRYKSGWLSRYAAMVTNAGRGAVLEWPQATDAASNGVEPTSKSTPVTIEALTYSTRDRYRPTPAGVSR